MKTIGTQILWRLLPALLLFAGVARAQDSETWNDDRVGLFVHWGLYSATEGAWNGSTVGGASEWIQHGANLHSSAYSSTLKPLFTPSTTWATDLAQSAKDAGMEYVVITAKHHDGFTLFNSDEYWSTGATNDPARTANPYGGSNISPPGRDLMQELATAVRAEGLKVGFYYSVIDWQHPNAYRGNNGLPKPNIMGNGRVDENTAEPDPAAGSYKTYLFNHVEQLVTQYGDINEIWFDFSSTTVQDTDWDADALMAMIRTNQPNLMVNNRLYAGLENPNGDFATPERTIPATGLSFDWETVTSWDDTSWGYKSVANGASYKTARHALELYAEASSKGGNMLLNIGPDRFGATPTEQASRMTELGDWMDVNGEALKATRASGIDASGMWGRMTMNKSSNQYYAIVFDRPADGVIDITAVTTRKIVHSISASLLTTSGPVVAPITENNGIYTVSLHAGDLDTQQSATFRIDIDATEIPVAPITWTATPAPVEGGAGVTLSAGLFTTNGLRVHAENCGGGAMEFDGIPFAAGSTDFGASYDGFHAGNQLSSSATYGSDGTQGNVLLTGLTPGTNYVIQALVYDGRGEDYAIGRTVEFDGIDQGQFANGVSGSTYGDGMLVTGTFTANAATQPFTIEVFKDAVGKGGQLNALTVFDPNGTPAPPEPPLVSLLTNGEFEDPVVVGERTIDIDTESTFITGWTLIGATTGKKATLFESNWDFWGQLPNLSNGQYASFNSKDGPFGDAIEQTFATSVGELINVSYLVGNGSFSTLDAAMQLDITSEGGTLGDLVSQVSTHGTDDGFTEFSAAFTATTTNTTIRFTDVSTGSTTSADTLLDQVFAAAASTPSLPATITVAGPVDGGTAMAISWVGAAGKTYRVETNANLIISSGWAPMATGMTGTGAAMGVTNVITGDQLFYRVITE